MKLTYTNPAWAKGEELDLVGFGTIKNGEEFEVSDEQAKEFKARTGRTLADAAKGAHFEKAKEGGK